MKFIKSILALIFVLTSTLSSVWAQSGGDPQQEYTFLGEQSVEHFASTVAKSIINGLIKAGQNLDNNQIKNFTKTLTQGIVDGMEGGASKFMSGGMGAFFNGSGGAFHEQLY